MRVKTQIIVLRMKRIIYAGIAAAVGILILVSFFYFLSKKEKPADTALENSKKQQEADSVETATLSNKDLYHPGIYTTQLYLGGQTIDVEVIVDAQQINSIRLVNPDDAVTTMYPLLQPTMDQITAQVFASQSLNELTYNSENKYTSLVLIQAIQSSLDNARIEDPVNRIAVQ